MKDHVKKLISCVLLIAAVGLIAAGVLSGGYREVWSKAAMICLECIGIG